MTLSRSHVLTLGSLLLAIHTIAQTSLIPPTNTPTANGTSSSTLTWTASPSPELVGYNIYYGTTSRTYTNEISTGLVTNLLIAGLDDGQTYYFASAAVNSSGIQSALSPEASYTVQPQPEPGQVWILVSQSPDGGITWSNVYAAQDPLTNQSAEFRIGWQMIIR